MELEGLSDRLQGPLANPR